MIRKNLSLLQLLEKMVADPATSGAIIVRNFDAGYRFIQQEQHGLYVYVIKSGVSKCMITEENGKEYILEFLGEGEMLGEIEAIRKLPTVCCVEAITPITLYAISVVQFHYFLQQVAAFNAEVMQLLAARVANSSVKMARQQLLTLSSLLPALQEMLADQQFTFTKQDLAGYLGISVRSLNRMLEKKE